jgi:hypothetical protein
MYGVICFMGMLSNQWIVHDLYAIDFLPRGVRWRGSRTLLNKFAR